MPKPESILERLQMYNWLPESLRSEFYDNNIASNIKDVGESVLKTRANLGLWLQIQYATRNWAIEGVSEVTFSLYKETPEQLQEEVMKMSEYQKSGIDMLLKEFDGEDYKNLEASFDLTSELTTIDLTTVVGLKGSFVGTSTRTSTRGFPIASGTLTLNTAGNRVYNVNCGGGAANFRTRNGYLPPGVYSVSNHRPNRDTQGMVLNNVGFSFDLNPSDGTDVYGRSEFRIHPDGLSEGTNGCIGVREDATKLRECETKIAGLLESSPFKISVQYNF